jgi:hypothetical protein
MGRIAHPHELPPAHLGFEESTCEGQLERAVLVGPFVDWDGDVVNFLFL